MKSRSLRPTEPPNTRLERTAEKRAAQAQRHASSLMPSYEDLTLEELENKDWGEPDYPSYLVTTVHRLRRVPVKELVIEDLRIMIGQQIGLKYLLPLALDRLEDGPFAEGDFYSGDLLMSVLGVNLTFWEQHPDLRQRMDAIIETAKAQIGARG